jgi:DNA ligase-1
VPIDAQWEQIRYLVFDMPTNPDAFESRMAVLETVAAKCQYIEAVPQVVCDYDEQFFTYMDSVIAGGGEGLMAREPGSFYVGKRSSTLLKVKRMSDVEATVQAYQAGEGKHTGRMGALLCILDSGVSVKVGTGFNDRQRKNPPDIGARVTIRYQELSKDGVPRFPVFVAARDYE